MPSREPVTRERRLVDHIKEWNGPSKVPAMNALFHRYNSLMIIRWTYHVGPDGMKPLDDGCDSGQLLHHTEPIPATSIERPAIADM
jgi:hypothetical protein